MGTWGVGLYSSDMAQDLRGCISAVARLPFEPGRLLETVCMSEPASANDVTDSDHTVFWLVTADQFARKGIDCPAARDRALAIIADGADLAMMASLGMDDKLLAKRRLMLEDLRVRLAAPVEAGKRRSVLKAPQKLLLEVGETLIYPVSRTQNGFEPINPYAVGKEWAWVKAWKQVGWGAMVVAERGLLFDFLAWYRPLVAYQALTSEPTLAELAAPRAWTLKQSGTLSARHYANLQLKSVGRIGVDAAKLGHFFPGRVDPVGPVVIDYSISGSFGCHAKEPDDPLWDIAANVRTPRLTALSDIEAGPEDADRRNLSGPWRGEYTEEGQTPNAFRAAFREVAGLVRGELTEIEGPNDRAGRPMEAAATGRRSGQAIRFIKRYVSATKRYIPVQYDGEIDETGARIAGGWSMRNGRSGCFEMWKGEPGA